MASKAAQKRLGKEFVAMQREPPPFVWAVPDEKNILTWDFIIRGPPESPYVGGEYHGQLMFPSEYPFKPPGIKMLTPSGRFQPDKKICFSMSDFHPGSWNPAWSVATILTGLLSFMLSDEMTTGSVNTSPDVRRAYAARSHEWNLAHSRFREVFPEYCTPQVHDLPNMAQKEQGQSTSTQNSEGNPSTVQPRKFSVRNNTTNVLPNPAESSLQVARQATSALLATTQGPKDKQDEARTATAAAAGSGWATSWSQVIWEKWRWGALIAIAVLVSRLSST